MEKVQNPASSGEAGADFEFRVGGCCLTLLLTRGAPLFLGSGAVSAVSFQTSYLGWATDDLLLEATDDAGVTRKAAIQVKRSFVLSTTDEECVKTLRKAFTDFRNVKIFNPQFDVVGLVTSGLSAKLIRGLRTLLDCARASTDATDMGQRFHIPGYLGLSARSYYESIATILQGIDEQKPTEEEIWRFLCCFSVLDLDLNVEGGATETMMRTLLLVTSRNRNPTDANATWNELCALAGMKIGTAASYTTEKLPASIRQRHDQTSSYPAGVSRLLEDTRVVVDGIRTTIGETNEVPRREIFGHLCQLLEDEPIAFVTGEAGSGKSMLGKKAFGLLTRSAIGFAFRAESLAGTHINEVLARFGLTLDGLRAQTAIHGRKFLWIESLERLMEKPAEQRAAFLDLLRAIKSDSTWRLLITCRDYSAETVKSAFFGEVGISVTDLLVPELDDTELEELVTAVPILQRPMSSDSLRKVLRKPFLLDKAARMQWPESEPLPQHERAFREKVWREVICKNEDLASGFPKLRGDVLIGIALRRAKAMEPYVHADDLDVRARHALLRDNLLAGPDVTLLAPAHDVYEDWALSQWLDMTFERNGRRLNVLFPLIGTYPALRRAFRKWLAELLDAVPQTTDTLILDVIRDTSVAAHWREDTLVGVLLSKNANGFLLRNAKLLIADSAKLLRQVVHILRVACRTAIPRRLFGLKGEGDIFLPSGNGWGGAAELMDAAADQFGETDFPFVLGFLEDWSSLTRWNISYPRGAKSIAKLVFRWLPIADSWRCPVEDGEDRLLKVLLKIPLAGEPKLSEMVEEAFKKDRRGHRDSGLPSLIFSHLYGDAVCRDMPDLAFRVAEHELGLDLSVDEAVKRQSGYEMNAINDAFGFGFRFGIEDYPESAYHGPYFRLLSYHPDRGIELILRLMNRSCEAFALSHRIRGLREPGRVSIRFPDATVVEQFGNGRLWELYRGFTQGPDVMKSALMALERWLLQKAGRGDTDLPAILSRLMRESNNIAITAVVASVATAYPNQAGDAAFTVLTCRHFFKADLERSVSETMYAPRAVSQVWTGVENRIFEEERAESARLPHRQRHLEYLAVVLQGTPWRERVWALFDAYKAELPTEKAQNEEDKIWRFRIHQMDVRTFVEVGKTEDGQIIIQAGTPPPELQELLEEKQSRSAAWDATVQLLMWGRSVFEGNSSSGVDPMQWRKKLSEAATQVTAIASFPDEVHRSLAMAGPAYVAAICIRDHWAELEQGEREWCVNLTCDAVEKDADSDNDFKIAAINAMEASRPAALVLPALFGKDIASSVHSRLLPTLAKAISHSVDEVVKCVVQGIGAFLWKSDRALALTCVHALILAATKRNEFWTERRRASGIEKPTEEQFTIQLRTQLREFVEQRKFQEDTAILKLDLMDWPGRQVSTHLFTIFGSQPTDPLAQNFFRINTARLAARWTTDRDEHRSRRPKGHDEEKELDSTVEHQFVDAITQFLLQLSPNEAKEICEPLFSLATLLPAKAAEIVKWLITRQGDRIPATTLWMLWQRFADQFLGSALPASVDTRHSDSAKLLRELFLGGNWGEMREWKPLDGERYRIRKLFDELPPSREAFEAYSYFLAKIGTPDLPQPMISLSAKLPVSNPASLFSESTVFYIEAILTRLIYGGNRQIRGEAPLRQSTIKLLDALVAAGSSAAYKLRDDFVTPTPGA